MKRNRHSFVFVLLVCSFASLLLFDNTPALHSAVKAQSPRSITLHLGGLRDKVTIYRDSRGIPYIAATNERDLYFAHGYIVASDRLWQMDLLRRTGSGELSEIFGTRTLGEDKRRRTYGYAQLAKQMVNRLSPPARAATEAYVLGVNAFIKSLDKKSLPPEFGILKYEPRPWTMADSLIIGKIFSESLTTTWPTDLFRAALAILPQARRDALLPSISPLDLIIVGSDEEKKSSGVKSPSSSAQEGRAGNMIALDAATEDVAIMRRSLERVGLYAEELAASNNWVVNGQRSVTGFPLLANDPHLTPATPSLWYMIHLSAPGLRAAGVTVPGVPGIFIGHNENIAWGSTNVVADVQDVYMEKFSKDDPSHYLTPDGWQKADVRREEIKVRKNFADPATDTITLDVTITRHGPIVLERDGVRYALAWPALDPTTNEFEAYYFVNRARNWQDFRAALKDYTGFPLNFVYADTKGHIGYWAAGRYPIRKTGQGLIPNDGTVGESDWRGYIPFERTHHLYDPPSGVIVTANNRTVGRSYPYYITDEWAAPYRARRIYNLLMAKPKLSVEDFQAIQADTYSHHDATFIAEVIKLGRPLEASSPEWHEILAAFEGWDATMNPKSHNMPLSYSLRQSFQQRILTSVLGAELMQKYSWPGVGTLVDHIITTRPREWLPKEFDSYEALILACYKDACDTITSRIGPDKSQWIWGRFAQMRLPHPLANAPIVGGQFTIDPIPQSGGGMAVNRGASVSMRYIADVSNWDNSRQNITPGQSGNPQSPHWKDQLIEWRTVTPGKFPFSKNSVAKAAKDTLILAAPLQNARK